MKILRTIILCFWVFLGLCCRQDFAGVDSSGPENTVPELRVMSFNIRYGTADDGENNWKNRRDIVFDLLRVHRCDVIGLQEAVKFQIDAIMEAVPQFAMVGVGRDDGKTKGEYCAILYDRERLSPDESGTFWLSDTPEVPGSITWGNACTRICTWARFMENKSRRAFYVYNMHLDHVSQPSREKSVVLVAERIGRRKYKDPYIITGDFNTGENNPAILFLQGKHAFDDKAGGEITNPFIVVDTFRLLHPDAKEVGTFNRFRGIRTGDKIDYIFTTPKVTVLEAAIIRDNTDGRFPSDHFPVTAKLGLLVNSND
ncbi:MAG: endonuclease/exonuclease/phosphatase family protein [Sedimentisphaerales bacterium]|nr:endonuclease/exonuclease/phosphatase family protein [Sedimentisphaerales bacterium]